MKIHEFYMNRALQLGRMATVQAAPNPGVGCCIVDSRGKVIAEGYSDRFGGPHAEVQALARIPEGADLGGSRMYVTLEPCSHFGKTPPCADAIAASGIEEIFVGIADPNPLVSGRGLELLRRAGKTVNSGLLEKSCRFLHRRFLSRFEKGRPYITLKWARSADGFVAPATPREERAPHWVSNTYSRQLAHRLRTEHSAILIGSGTALADNPRLDSRVWYGPSPVRVLLDRRGRVPRDSALFSDSTPTVVLTTHAQGGPEDIRWEPGQKGLAFLMEELLRRDIYSLLVEGGPAVWKAFMQEELWDEIWEFRSDNILQEGLSAPQVQGVPDRSLAIMDDTLNIYYRDKEHHI